MPCRPISPLRITASPGADLGRRDRGGRRDAADPRGVDEQAVGLAPIDDLGVAGDQADAGGVGATAHRLDHPAQGRDRQAFFEDEADAQAFGARAAHGEVVDGAVDGERADVAAGKEQRPHDIGIGREGGRAVDRQHGAVVAAVEFRIVERRANHVVDQAGHRPAAAAVGELDRFAVVRRGRAGQGDLVGAGHATRFPR